MNNRKAWKLEKEYHGLFWSGVINGVGNRFTQVAVLALLYKITDSALAIGLLFAIRMLPYILLAPFGGMMADVFSKKKLLVFIDFIRVPFALMPIFVHDPEHLWIIYVSAFCIAAGEAVYVPTRMASIPLLVKQDRLLYINAIEQIMIGVVLVFGSSIGGIISFTFGLSTAFTLDALSFLLSAFIVRRIAFPTPKFSQTQEANQKKLPIGKVVLASGVLLTFVFIGFTMPLANGIDNVLMSIYALEVFKMGDIGVGLIYACLGLGFMLSSSISRFFRGKLVMLVVVCIGLEGLGHILLGVTPTFMAALFVVVSITFVGGISDICLSTLTMKLVPLKRQGAFFGLMAMITNTSLGISMGVAGFLIDLFDPRHLSIIVGFTYICFTIIYAKLFTRFSLQKEKRDLNRRFG